MNNKWLVYFYLTTAAILPFWVYHFYRFADPTSAVFLSNFYHYPVRDVLNNSSGILVSLLLFLVIFLTDRFVADRGASYRRAATGFYLGTVFLVYAFFGSAVLFRLFLKLGLLPSAAAAGWATAFLTTAVTVGLLWLFFRGYNQVIGFLSRQMPLIFVLIGLVVVINALFAQQKLEWLWRLDFTLAETPTPVERATSPGPKHRIVLQVFDGWDHDIAFRDDPELELPNTRRLAADGFWAVNARSPGRSTLKSLPGLLLGKEIEEAEPGPLTIRVWEKGREEGLGLLLPREATLFNDLSAMGKRVATMAQLIVGHPYCRMFSGLIHQCWEDKRWWSARERHDAMRNIPNFLNVAFQHGLRYFDARTIRHMPGYTTYFKRFKDNAFATLCDQDLDFVYIHWMMPHSPFLYDHNANRMIPAVKDVNLTYDAQMEFYKGNLEMTDKVLGEMMRHVESCGVADNTTFLFTADHGQRPQEGSVKSQHVVFLARMPGNPSPMQFTGPAPLSRVRGIVSGIFQGRIRTYAQLAEAFSSRN
ncbi:MAG: sulfatase-like hydrolase/transferase [Rhodospirillales bacterium]|nr:sulfatase-like hydrolase/transferase [Rhodospirillales bacterium]